MYISPFYLTGLQFPVVLLIFVTILASEPATGALYKSCIGKVSCIAHDIYTNAINKKKKYDHYITFTTCHLVNTSFKTPLNRHEIL